MSALSRPAWRHPPNLLLDEPVAGLDRRTAEALLTALPARGITSAGR
ncbi:hypothetical protein [Streptomyces rugosispiralis]|uniref:ABC transporter ATP-binding protein n=1 Tax=Streptomyces rugosispiralis TaxID=2967341 RepID=A0ABT1V769_9ACTN|nr:hypothetical protein [Streptomyces rugosispiralis]MCQ8193234.1 hypothetical protein [Streptomyces rugosispiralis]